jgi:hypothetical protein
MLVENPVGLGGCYQDALQRGPTALRKRIRCCPLQWLNPSGRAKPEKLVNKPLIFERSAANERNRDFRQIGTSGFLASVVSSAFSRAKLSVM